jgi:D-alanyl-lipoteichoic acid acyltransferase DltB (MBOAT superfamily)
MSFVSLEFVIFFAGFLVVYFAVPQRWRWPLLLVGSYFFYAYWNAGYVLLIVFTTLVDYSVGRLLEATDPAQRRKRRFILAVSLSINLGVLFLFKYFNFFTSSIAALLDSLRIPYSLGTLRLVLPLGISFYTFQSMAYTIDVYRGTVRAERHLGIFATFVAFFPQLVAGPIERAGHMLPQFRQRVTFDEKRVVEGLRLILWGAFKKIVIADRLAVYVNTVYNQPTQYSGAILILATFFFTFQIYCDFSGYSDIAIGVARVIGFRLMDNFHQPYFSRSVREFWRRWHISLSSWFRDYLYIPLGGSRVPLARQLLNLMIVFLVSGLWHGASWTFVIWGGLHGLFVVIETLLARRKSAGNPSVYPRLAAIGQVALTFTLVAFAWIFFRANSLSDAGHIISHLFDFSNGLHGLTAPFNIRERLSTGLEIVGAAEMALTFALLGLLLLADWFDLRGGLTQRVAAWSASARWAAYYGLALAIGLSLLIYGQAAKEFIYFQF